MNAGLAAWSFPLGLALDAVIGDPRGWPHPVRAIGWFISATETILRSAIRRLGKSPGMERIAGIFLTLIVVGAAGLAAWCIVAACDRLGPVPSLLGRAALIHFGLAARSLRDETLRASESPDLPSARRELAMIVGRDTAGLDWPEIHRACVETVAENANDGVIAAIFWYGVGGPVGMWIYKAINTLDSMVGYRNERYRQFGWASARLDDVIGLIPARLSWLLISLSAWVAAGRPLAGLKIGWRDGRNHPSPNSAWSEAAMAGALGVQLGGKATYGGVASVKPSLGDPGRAIDARTVRGAVRVMVVACLIASVLAWTTRVVVLGLA